MFDSAWLKEAVVSAPVLIAALTVHEYFHAWTAYRFGDSTARDEGRLTLNPIAHLDPIGTVLLFLVGFGWAKPVPVNPYNLRNPRVADFWISAAGPLSNLGMALIFSVLMHILVGMGLHEGGTFETFVYLNCQNGIWINLILAFFNLIPLYPLDGSHILRNVLPQRYEATIEKIQRIGPILLMGLLFLGVIGSIIGPFVTTFYVLLAP